MSFAAFRPEDYSDDYKDSLAEKWKSSDNGRPSMRLQRSRSRCWRTTAP